MIAAANLLSKLDERVHGAPVSAPSPPNLLLGFLRGDIPLLRQSVGIKRSPKATKEILLLSKESRERHHVSLPDNYDQV
jgi:hypothetical protein